MAATDVVRPIKNAPFRATFVTINATGLNPITGGLTGLDSEISKDGGGFADAGTETEDGTSGWGSVDLTATHMTADEVRLQVKATNSGAVTHCQVIRMEPALDSGVAQTGSTTTITLRASASAVDDFYNNELIEIVRGTGAGQSRIIRDYVGSTQIATVDLPWVTAPDVTSIYIIKASSRSIRGTESDSGTAQGGSSSSIVLASTASATNDLYNGSAVSIIRGTGAGQTRIVSDYVGSSKTASVDVNWVTSPDSTSVYIVYPTAQSTRSDTLVSEVDVIAINGDTDAAENLALLYTGGLVGAAIDDVSPTVTEFNGDSSLVATDDFYNGKLMQITSGAAKPLCTKVIDYVGSTRTFTLSPALKTAPANGDTFVLVAAVF